MWFLKHWLCSFVSLLIMALIVLLFIFLVNKAGGTTWGCIFIFLYIVAVISLLLALVTADSEKARISK